MDMLEIGNGGMAYDEYVSHFSLWAALKSPLILGNDVANMTKETASILKNKEIIDVNQDPLGMSAYLVERFTEPGFITNRVVADIWVGPLINNDAVASRILFLIVILYMDH